jgi:branched-subunit amino acid ABC-type transport system permease component
MEIFVQQLINGIMLGSIYGRITIGCTMVFCIRRAPSQPSR